MTITLDEMRVFKMQADTVLPSHFTVVIHDATGMAPIYRSTGSIHQALQIKSLAISNGLSAEVYAQHNPPLGYPSTSRVA